MHKSREYNSIWHVHDPHLIILFNDWKKKIEEARIDTLQNLFFFLGHPIQSCTSSIQFNDNEKSIDDLNLDLSDTISKLIPD